jgi:hypothetical protein
VDEWNAIPEYRAGLERTLGADGASRLDEAVSRGLPRLQASARCLHDNVAKIVAAAQQMRRGAA